MWMDLKNKSVHLEFNPRFLAITLYLKELELIWEASDSSVDSRNDQQEPGTSFCAQKEQSAQRMMERA